MTNDVAIEVENLGKRYHLVGEGGYHQDTLRDVIAVGFRSLIGGNGKPRPGKGIFWALRNATFKIRRGENVGIIGLNGAGKSTLLKVLSRITEPTEGSARIEGRVGALLEVGTGFHWELSGRENVYLYGAILGMRKAEIARKYNNIVSFAGIGDFIDTPVKRYSSGMYVRLAFAVAAHLQPEILLLDEVLAVGDLSFQRKCVEFIRELQRRNGTILFVSHNMFSIKTMCPRVIYLRRGQIEFDGPTDQGIKLYEDDCRLSTVSWTENEHSKRRVSITDITLFDEDGQPKTVFDYGERMKVCLKYEAFEPVATPNFIVAFIRSDRVQACVYSSEADGVVIDQVSGDGVIDLMTPPLKLVADLYTVQILVRERGFQEVICAQVGCAFHVRHDLFDAHFGMFHETGEWSEKDSGGRAKSRLKEASTVR